MSASPDQAISPRGDYIPVAAWGHADFNGFDWKCVDNIGGAADCFNNCFWDPRNNNRNAARFFTYNGNDRKCCCKIPAQSPAGSNSILLVQGWGEMVGYDFPNKFDVYSEKTSFESCRSNVNYGVNVYRKDINGGTCFYKTPDDIPGRPDVVTGYGKF